MVCLEQRMVFQRNMIHHTPLVQIHLNINSGCLCGLAFRLQLKDIKENRGREYDILKILDELETISEYTELRLNLNLFIHEDYNSQILSNLKEIPINSDDVVFFYYSGHGYRDDDKDTRENPWPNLHITLEDKGIDHRTITEILEANKPKLLFSLVNSCNKITKSGIELVKNGLGYRTGSELLRKENYKKLFLETSGVIISSSAIPGQFSYRKPNAGTLFLDALLTSLHEEVEEVEYPDWEIIFQRTAEKTQVASKGKQYPQYELYLYCPAP